VANDEEELDMSQTIEHLTYSVPGMSCDHCRAAVTAEIEKVSGVAAVDVDLQTKRVRVSGSDLDDGAVRAAIDEAGYDVA
jgi:copper chaperone